VRSRELITKALPQRILLGNENFTNLNEMDIHEAVLEASLKELTEKAHDMEARRMQALVVAFGAGLSSIVIGAVLFRIIAPLTSSHGTQDSRVAYATFRNEEVEVQE